MNQTKAYQVGKLRAEGGCLLDREGRQVVLHGVNLVCKDKSRGYIGHWTVEEFDQLHALGMNVIRLGLLWAGLEPEPGLYDEAYLDRVEHVIRRAGKAGLHVFLDMHQDLYGEAFADGAPAWATLCEDVPHDASGMVWSDAYLNSKAVQTAFDRFWANEPAADGTGVQDHYARAWRRVAERFGCIDCVIGYDLMNEPFPGSPAVEIEQAMIQAFLAMQQETIAQPDASNPPVEEASAASADLANAWMDPEGRAQVLSLLTDPDVYEAISEGMEPGLHKFDKTMLSPFYQRVADAIREVDTETLLFLEASYFSNMGVRSGIAPVLRKGTRDPQQIYAPHGYDLIVDTTANELWSPARVEVIFRHHAETGARHCWPMLVGEWGAFWQNAEGDGCGTKAQADQLRTVFEEMRCGDAFWCYPDEGARQQNLDGFRYSGAIVRGVPQAVNGGLRAYRWMPEESEFRMEWEEGGSTADTTAWVPGPVLSALEITTNGVQEPANCLLCAIDGGTFLSFPPRMPGMKRNVLIRHGSR